MMSDEKPVVERDWDKLREDVNDCIDTLEVMFESDHSELSEDEVEELEAKQTGLIKLLALFCGGVEAMFPDAGIKSPETIFHEKLFNITDKPSKIH